MELTDEEAQAIIDIAETAAAFNIEVDIDGADEPEGYLEEWIMIWVRKTKS